MGILIELQCCDLAHYGCISSRADSRTRHLQFILIFSRLFALEQSRSGAKLTLLLACENNPLRSLK
jgi:hypothetical protein